MTGLISRWAERILGLGACASVLRSISFSQYSEDVLLYHFHPQRTGFYIDVGACHPWRGSNTYKLYLRGWRGITIEPNPDVATHFARMRPRDTHLTVGISSECSELDYYRFSDHKLNSFDPEQARRMGVKPIGVAKIPCQPLIDIIEKCCADTKVDLLSIDCEGFDLIVLESLNLEVVRPTIIIIEDFDQIRAADPNGAVSNIRRHLEGRNYILVSQCLFSSLYLDASSSLPCASSGFRIDQSQIWSVLAP